MRGILLAPLLALSLPSCATGGPEALAQELRDAFAAGDAERAIALFDIEQSPHVFVRHSRRLVTACIHTRDCTVTLADVDATWAEADAASHRKNGLELPQSTEGVVSIRGVPRSAHAKYIGELSADLPYASIAGRTRVISPRYSAARLSELRDKDARALVESLFAEGVSVVWSDERQMDWATKATPLPDGGGEIGRLYVERIERLHRAALAGDLETMVAIDRSAAREYADQQWDGTPIPRELRLAELRDSLPSMLATVRVSGGYRYETPADPYVEYILLVDGQETRGWVARGPVRVSMIDGELSIERPALSYPAAP